MAVKAYGTTLGYRTPHAVSGSFTALARVKSIKPARVTAKDIDITVLDSPDEFDEMIAGLASGGELEATLEYAPAQTAVLFGMFRVDSDFQLTYPNATGWTYRGYINEIGEEEVVNGEVLRTAIKIRVTTKPVLDSTP